jgi:hypothetical protein
MVANVVVLIRSGVRGKSIRANRAIRGFRNSRLHMDIGYWVRASPIPTFCLVPPIRDRTRTVAQTSRLFLHRPSCTLLSTFFGEAAIARGVGANAFFAWPAHRSYRLLLQKYATFGAASFFRINGDDRHHLAKGIVFFRVQLRDRDLVIAEFEFATRATHSSFAHIAFCRTEVTVFSASSARRSTRWWIAHIEAKGVA